MFGFETAADGGSKKRKKLSPFCTAVLRLIFLLKFNKKELISWINICFSSRLASIDALQTIKKGKFFYRKHKYYICNLYVSLFVV